MGSVVIDRVRDEAARQLWRHGYAEGWLDRDRMLKEQQPADRPATWWERLVGKRHR